MIEVLSVKRKIWILLLIQIKTDLRIDNKNISIKYKNVCAWYMYQSCKMKSKIFVVFQGHPI